MSFETMLVMGQWRGEIKHRCHWKLESCKQEQLVQLPLQFSFSITQLELSLLLSHRYDYITRTSGSEALSPKRSTWLILQFRGMFLHFLFPLWIHFLFSRFQARVALYTEGKEDLSIVFNSTSSNNVNWFSETRVTDSPWTDLNTEPLLFFSIEGCCTKRDFYIVRNHGGCSEDAGWLATASANCDWEGKHPESTTLYSKLTTYTSFKRIGKGKWRKLVTVNLPLENIHFEIPGDPCNLSGSHRCSWFTKHTIFTLNQSHLFHNQWERFA